MRITWPDHLKAFGMVLVVYGHSLSTGWGSGQWIYAFHMPLFFLLSGYLIKDQVLALPFGTFAVRTLRSLLPAYLFFAAVGYAAWWFVLRRFGADAETPIPAWYPLVAIVYGTASTSTFNLFPTVLWFFPCLISAQLMFHPLHRLGLYGLLFASALVACVGFALPKWLALPYELETALVAQLFIALGYTARRVGLLERVTRNATPLGAGLVLIGSVMAFANSAVDMRSSTYGQPLLFLACALTLCVGFALLFMPLRRHAVAEFIARNTIVIFPLHPLVFTVFGAIYVFVLGLPLGVREHPLVGIVASLVNLGIVALCVPVVRRVVPWVYGLKPTETPRTVPGVAGAAPEAAPAPAGRGPLR